MITIKYYNQFDEVTVVEEMKNKNSREYKRFMNAFNSLDQATFMRVSSFRIDFPDKSYMVVTHTINESEKTS